MTAGGIARYGPASVPAARRPVIAGLGMTQIGKVFGLRNADFAAQARLHAAADAAAGTLIAHHGRKAAEAAAVTRVVRHGCRST
jgi:hypothetical protein